MTRETLTIRLETRSDGSVLVSSEQLPLFCISGEDLRCALLFASEILPEFVERNKQWLAQQHAKRYEDTP